MHKFVLYCWLLIISIPAAAQLRPHDKYYLQLDRSGYAAGETVWFKAYMLTDFYPTSNATSIHVDLLDTSGIPIASKMLPIFSGTAAGNIDLPLAAQTGVYFLRLHQPLNPVPIYTRMIYVLNATSPAAPMSTANTQQVDCKFYTSNTSLVAGLTNTIYFKGLDEFGFAKAVEGRILNAAKEPVSTFSSSYNGLGKLEFLPSKNEKYTAEIQSRDGAVQTIALPPVKEAGVIVSASDVGKGKRITVQSARTQGQLNIVGLMGNDIIFQKTFTPLENYSFILPTEELLSGLVRIVVYDGSRILASTTSFVSTATAALPIGFTTTTQTPTEDSVSITLDFPDSIIGSFAVSVTNYDNAFEFSRNNIAADLLVDQLHPETIIAGDLASGSFTLDQKSLDLYAATTDWPAMTVKELIAPAPAAAYFDTNFITMRGKVYKKNTNVLVKKGEVNFIFHGADSTTSFLAAPINEDGSIEVKNLIFYDTSTVSYELNGKNKESIVIQLEPQNPRPANVSAAYLRQLTAGAKIDLPGSGFITQAKLAHDLFMQADKRSTTLTEVKLTAKRGTPTQQVNEKYTRGVFQSSNMARTIDLINNPPGMTGGNILDYLQGQFPGLLITKNGVNYTITSQRQLSISNTPPMRFFLNEQEITLDFLVPLRVHEIALVKYYSPGNSLPGIGIAGALAVYTKKQSDLSFPSSSRINSFKYGGYSPTKDFGAITGGEAGDFTPSTLYWNPNIAVDSETKQRTFRFKRYKGVKQMQVVIEGFTADGRIAHLEKVIN